MKRLYVLAAAAVLMALAPSSAAASTSYTESIGGIETAVPTPCGPAHSGDSLSPFAGAAFGTITGAFTAAICHTALPSATILAGGSFNVTGQSAKVSGQFANGTVAQVGSTGVHGFICIQKYSVTGGLSPAGTFAAHLTHFGLWNGKTCHVFFATVAGTATLIT